MGSSASAHPFRLAVAWLSTFVLALGAALFLFSLGLIVLEAVIWPTATLATSVIAALAASSLSDWAMGDGTRAWMSEVARRNLAWALIPALLILLFPLLIGQLRLIWWIGLVAIYTTAAGTYFASRLRGPAQESKRLRTAVAWLGGTIAGVIAIIFVASLFGLTGA